MTPSLHHPCLESKCLVGLNILKLISPESRSISQLQISTLSEWNTSFSRKRSKWKRKLVVLTLLLRRSVFPISCFYSFFPFSPLLLRFAQFLFLLFLVFLVSPADSINPRRQTDRQTDGRTWLRLSKEYKEKRTRKRKGWRNRT